MQKFRKKPVIIQAIQYNGQNAPEILFWVGMHHVKMDELLKRAFVDKEGELIIPTLEDGSSSQVSHVASVDDWIIKGVNGEFYPCKPDIFEKTYESVD